MPCVLIERIEPRNIRKCGCGLPVVQQSCESIREHTSMPADGIDCNRTVIPILCVKHQRSAVFLPIFNHYQRFFVSFYNKFGWSISIEHHCSCSFVFPCWNFMLNQFELDKVSKKTWRYDNYWF